jgi:outer membrane protein OmpA-like peptidoglycan-associated protein
MMMAIFPNSFPRQLAVLVLASAVGIPAVAQQNQPAGDSQSAPSSVRPQQPSSAASSKEPTEGFWGRVNPFARKKWVNKRIDPLKDQLGELDEVSARNARDIQDVDGRAQAGIRHAQSTADAASLSASAADGRARAAGSTAQGAADHVDHLNSTVAGLDQFHQASEFDITFRAGQPILSAAARKQLDDLAASVTGHQGYIFEMEAHSPLAGSAGIQSSQRLAEAVKRYLVTQHQIPVYRLHSVALGNVAALGSESVRPVKVSSAVHIRLMENSLAAQEAASPQGSASLTGAERP